MELMKKYILDEKGEPVPIEDEEAWMKWREEADSNIPKFNLIRLREDSVPWSGGVFMVATHFLGQSWRDPPELWETMVFPGDEWEYWEDGRYVRNYRTRQEANEGHDRTVRAIERLLLRYAKRICKS